MKALDVTADLTVVLLTRNEEIHLARALESVRGIAREIVVVDSYSSDATIDIARAHGARVFQHEFVNYAKQYKWALDNASIASAWIMRMDADEVVEADLAAEIAIKLPKLPSSVTGVNLKRKHIFMGRWIKHGGRYPLILLRIWRNGKARIENRWMDEHMVLTEGRAVTFDGGFADHNLNDLTFFIDKHNKYATREAIDVLTERLALAPRGGDLTVETSSWQAAIKRFIKERVYNRLPFQISALSYFLYRYFVQLGFLDGGEGLIYHSLQGLWYRFLVGAKVFELERAVAGLRDPNAIRAELSRLTGLQVE